MLNRASLPESLASHYSPSVFEHFRAQPLSSFVDASIGFEHFRAQPLSNFVDASSIVNSDFAINFFADDEMNLASFSEASPIGG